MENGKFEKVEPEKTLEDLEKEKIQAKEKTLEDMRLDLTRFEIFHNININFNQTLLEQKEKLGLTEEEFNLYRQKIKKVAESCLDEDTNIYLAIKYFRILSETDRIIERIKKGVLDRGGYVSHDLWEATCEYGTEEQIREATKLYTKEFGLYALEREPYFKERFDEIEESLERYCQYYGIDKNFPIDAKMLNAAMEILQRGYNLAIGIWKAGTPIALMLEVAGMKTRYLEWHRGWKRGPIWKEAGRWPKKVEEDKKKRKIIVCEQDTHTGATLQAIMPAIKKLDPEIVDVCFWIDVHSTNKKIVKDLEFYRNGYNVEDFSPDNFWENLQNFLNIIRSKNFQELIK